MASTQMPEKAPLWRRLIWFVALWAGGVLAVGTVGLIIRFWISP